MERKIGLRRPISWVAKMGMGIPNLACYKTTRRDDFHGIRRIDCELRGQQTLREETADALDAARRAPTTVNPRTGSERRSAENF